MGIFCPFPLPSAMSPELLGQGLPLTPWFICCGTAKPDCCAQLVLQRDLALGSLLEKGKVWIAHIVKMLRIQLPCSNRLLSFSTCPTPGQNSFRQFVLGSSFGGKRAWPCLLWADSIGCSWAEHQNNPAGVLNTLHTLGKWAPAALQVGRSCSQPKCCEGGNELSKSSGLLAEVPTTCYSFRHPRSALGAMHRLDTNVFTVTKVPFPR